MGLITPQQVSDDTTADASDINTPINTIANEFNGNIDNANIKSAAAIDGSKIADNTIDIGGKASTWDGWIEVSDSWTYASATTVTVPSDATAKYSVGDKVKFVQTTTKYFYITAVAATTLTLNGGTDYTVANAAISAINYSKAETPLGFPGEFAYTPTWTTSGTTTLGNGTLTGYFSLRGKVCTIRTQLVWGTTTSATGSGFFFALPINNATTQYSVEHMPVGTTYLEDKSSLAYFGFSRIITTAQNKLTTNAGTSSGTYIGDGTLTPTAPFTWATGDFISAHATYTVA